MNDGACPHATVAHTAASLSLNALTEARIEAASDNTEMAAEAFRIACAAIKAVVPTYLPGVGETA